MGASSNQQSLWMSLLFHASSCGYGSLCNTYFTHGILLYCIFDHLLDCHKDSSNIDAVRARCNIWCPGRDLHPKEEICARRLDGDKYNGDAIVQFHPTAIFVLAL